MTNATESLIVCPPWCETDHETELAEVITRDEEACRWHDENYDRLRDVFGTDSHRQPGDPVRIDYTPIHRHLVGVVAVRTGFDQEPAPLYVTLEGQDDYTSVVLAEPHGWTEDYKAQEARDLARLLVVAAEMIGQ